MTWLRIRIGENLNYLSLIWHLPGGDGLTTLCGVSTEGRVAVRGEPKNGDRCCRICSAMEPTKEEEHDAARSR